MRAGQVSKSGKEEEDKEASGPGLVAKQCEEWEEWWQECEEREERV